MFFTIGNGRGGEITKNLPKNFKNPKKGYGLHSC